MNATLFVSLGFVLLGSLDPDRVLADAARGWDRYRLVAASAQGKVESWNMVNGVVMFRNKAEFRSGPAARTHVITVERRRKSTEPLQHHKVAFGVNSRYAFELEQPDKAKDGTWMLKGLVPASRPAEEFERVASNVVSSACLDPIAFGQHLLADLIRQPTFKLLGAEEVQRPEGTPVVRIEFDNTHPKDDFKAFPVQRGTIDLDPSSSWVLVAWNLIWHEGETQRGRIEYGPTVDGVALPRKFRKEGEFDGPGGRRSKSVVERTYEVSTSEPPLPEEEATLPAFGLPEPLELAPKPWYTRWPFWLFVGAGALCLIAGRLLRRRVARAV